MPKLPLGLLEALEDSVPTPPPQRRIQNTSCRIVTTKKQVKRPAATKVAFILKKGAALSSVEKWLQTASRQMVENKCVHVDVICFRQAICWDLLLLKAPEKTWIIGLYCFYELLEFLLPLYGLKLIFIFWLLTFGSLNLYLICRLFTVNLRDGCDLVNIPVD